MSPLAETADIKAAEQAIAERQTELEAAYQEATEALRARIAEREDAEAHQRLLFAIANRASGEVTNRAGRIKEETPLAVEAIIASMQTTGTLDLEPMAAIEALTKERARVLLFIEGIGAPLQEAAKQVKVARRRELLGEAGQVDALVALREHELVLALAGAVSAEGEIVVSQDHGVTSKLKQRSAEIRLRAAQMGEQN